MRGLSLVVGIFVGGAEASFLQSFWKTFQPGPGAVCDQIDDCHREACRVYETNRALVNRAVTATRG